MVPPGVHLLITRKQDAYGDRSIGMAGGSSLCIESRILPLDGAHVCQERLNFRWCFPM
jgi:hypothetical protein